MSPSRCHGQTRLASNRAPRATFLLLMYPQYSSPVKEKLLADLPLGPGQQQPPVLVLDLEGTLLGTIYTRKNGSVPLNALASLWLNE